MHHEMSAIVLHRGLLLLVSLTLVSACSPSDGTSSSSSTSSTTSEQTTTTAQTTTTGMEQTTTTVASTTSTTLRGDPVAGGPTRGSVFWVVGVAHDDVLNLRVAPGADQTIILGIPPTEDSVLALGETRALPAWWTRVEYDGVFGWVHLSYLAFGGATTDMTSEVLARTGGTLEAATMADLGLAVAEVVASEDPPSDIVMVVPATIGDLGEVTFDVIGLGDDSVRGIRLHVFGAQTGAGFSLKSVEGTALCDPTRGVTDDGLCV